MDKGIDYLVFHDSAKPWSRIHVFRINLNLNKLGLIPAKAAGLKHGFVNEFADEKVKLAVNGGFFDANYRPLGLRMDSKEKLSPLKRISWWGVFYIKNKQAKLTRANDFDAKATFAIQSGPRLIIDGQIPHLKPGEADRTALGITEKGEVLILVTENKPMSTTALAELMQDKPLLAVNALNLDGGSSSQLYAQLPDLHLDIHGFATVADAVAVKARV